MFGFEELHEDLRPHFDAERHLISHPLVVSVFHAPQMNKLVNRQYRAKLDLIEKKKADGDWTWISTLVEKPYRVEFMIKHYTEIPEDQWWPLVADVWTSVENLWQYKSFLPLLFRGKTGTVKQLFDEDDWQKFSDMPGGSMVVYRGCRWHNRKGWSWTLDRKVAEWFSRRFASKGQKSYVLSACIPREHIIWYTNCRKEQEAVISPANICHLAKTEITI